MLDIHLIALLGIFVAVIFPMCWLLAPQITLCFLCRSKPTGAPCGFCRQSIDTNISSAPKTFTSAVLNAGLILIISTFSIGFVWIEQAILRQYTSAPLQIQKNQTISDPQRYRYRIDEIIPMPIQILDINTPINVVHVEMSYDPTQLEVLDISTYQSFANIFIDKQLNRETGVVRLTGGIPNPGLIPKDEVFGTVYFKAVSPGVVKIDFLPSTMVLANDGKGTNVTKEPASVSYFILAERLTEEERTLQDQIFMQQRFDQPSYEKQTQIHVYNDQVEATTLPVPSPVLPDSSNFLDKFLAYLIKLDQYILQMWSWLRVFISF